MSKKWYFGILISALTLFVVVRQQAVVPNQEIVLEFVDVEVSALEVQQAITIVKKQLQSIGVKNTRISKGVKNGKFKITYYSDTDVERIKKILSEGQQVVLDHVFYDHNEENNPSPKDKKATDYSLNVYEIQQGTDIGSDFNGKYVLEVLQEQGGYSSVNAYSFVTAFDENRIDELIKVTLKEHKNIAIAIDNTSRNIPEVRAGPTT